MSSSVDSQISPHAPFWDHRGSSALTGEDLLPQSYAIVRLTHQSPDTMTLELEPTGTPLPRAPRPGQFYMLSVFDVGEVPISLTSRSSETGLVFTIRDVGPVTRSLTHLQAGTPVGVRGPFGSSWPLEQAQGGDVVLLAGGLGLAPLFSAIEEILTRRTDYERIFLLCGFRTPLDVIFQQELNRFLERKDLQTLLTVDSADPGWFHEVGVVTDLLDKAQFDPRATTALVCGPPIMMRFCARALSRRELPRNKIYLSMERNMRCAVGFCGHCQLGPYFVCRDGPVLPLPRLERWIGHKEM